MSLSLSIYIYIYIYSRNFAHDGEHSLAEAKEYYTRLAEAARRRGRLLDSGLCPNGAPPYICICIYIYIYIYTYVYHTEHPLRLREAREPRIWISEGLTHIYIYIYIYIYYPDSVLTLLDFIRPPKTH